MESRYKQEAEGRSDAEAKLKEACRKAAELELTVEDRDARIQTLTDEIGQKTDRILRVEGESLVNVNLT